MNNDILVGDDKFIILKGVYLHRNSRIDSEKLQNYYYNNTQGSKSYFFTLIRQLIKENLLAKGRRGSYYLTSEGKKLYEELED